MSYDTDENFKHSTESEPQYGPILLRSDNFTPPSRTPWGGTKILNKYKQLSLRSDATANWSAVGESWELSAGPEFPSTTDSGASLADILASDPSAMLGHEAGLGRTTTALLVKWIDAGDNLSLQIHPPDDYPGLAADEAGKHECWYVVDHEPGAGIYLGLRPGVNRDQVREALLQGADLSEQLLFIPVHRGDLFAIDPGTPHAIGKGITLIEPQYLAPGRRAVTYRYWDWNRCYDESGKLQPRGGKPRPIHLDHALAVTAWERASGDRLLGSSVLKAGAADAKGPARAEQLCAPDAPPGLVSSRLRVTRLSGTGTVVLPDWNALRSLTVAEGRVELSYENGRLGVDAGRTVAIPAYLRYIQARLQQAHALLCAAQA